MCPRCPLTYRVVSLGRQKRRPTNPDRGLGLVKGTTASVQALYMGLTRLASSRARAAPVPTQPLPPEPSCLSLTRTSSLFGRRMPVVPLRAQPSQRRRHLVASRKAKTQVLARAAIETLSRWRKANSTSNPSLRRFSRRA